MQAYSAYKDSGVEWLGEIPAGWEVKRLKYCALEVNQKIETKASYLDYYGMENVASWAGHFIGEAIQADGLANLFSEGDVLFGKLRPYLAKILLSDRNGLCSTEFMVLRVNRKIQSPFLSKLLISPTFVRMINATTYGSKMPRANPETIKNSQIPIPPLPEQTAIARFLDNKVGKIERLLAIKQQQIDLLKERQQILIQNAVTQGLNPNVPKKDSGIDWIGEIPVHWEVVKVKNVSKKVGSGITPSGGATTYLDSGIPLLRSQNILFGKIDLTEVARISPQVHNLMKNSQVEMGDVLLNITGASIGRCYFVEIDMPLNVNQHVCIIRPNHKVKSAFLSRLIASEIGQSQIWSFQQGGGREGLNFQSLKNFLITLPPIKEQDKIIRVINKQSKKINTAIQIKQQQIERLKEYKTTLINAAVTGKIKVPPC